MQSPLLKKIDRWLITNSSIPLTEKMFFTENLRVMVHAGLSLSEGLATLALQSESKTFRIMLDEVRSGVVQGKLLSLELAKFPKAFPEIFIKMIEVGEMSGTLEDTLQELTTQTKKDYNLRSKVKGAMTYPIVILVAMLGITTALLVFVLPKLLGIFKEFGDIQLPLPTRILIAVSDFTQAHGLLMAVGFAAIVGGSIAFVRTPFGRSAFHYAVIRSPLIGPVARKVNLARFSRTFSSLLRTDVPVVQSLTITAAVMGNMHYRASVLKASERIKKGDNISDTLKEYPKLYPPLVVQMTLVGERSGNIDGLLADVADFYEEQVDQTLANLSSIIEPILILVLGGMVGGIALAVMTPMYALTQSVSEQN